MTALSNHTTEGPNEETTGAAENEYEERNK